MRTYRKRAPEQRICKHCGFTFGCNHTKRIYCSDTCNVKAHRLRKGLKSVIVPPKALTSDALDEIELIDVTDSAPLLAPAESRFQKAQTVALGAGAVAVLKDLVVDSPRYHALKQRLDRQELKLNDVLDILVAVCELNPALLKRAKERAATRRANVRGQ